MTSLARLAGAILACLLAIPVIHAVSAPAGERGNRVTASRYSFFLRGTFDPAAGRPHTLLTHAAQDDSGRGLSYLGGPVEIDFGTLTAPARQCVNLRLDASREGANLLSLRSTRAIPFGHALEVRGGARVLRAGEGPVAFEPRGPLRLCLAVSRDATPSMASGEHWLELEAAGNDAARVHLALRWNVRGMPWWPRWRGVVLSAAVAFLVLVGIAAAAVSRRPGISGGRPYIRGWDDE